jgi:predicted Co/Zn/Cd cation transporter (cation efflux family)
MIMSQQTPLSYSQNEKKTNKQLGIYTAIWLITTALLAFGPKLIWDFSAAFTIIAVVLNLTAGGFMIMANIKHLNSLDELGRKIFLESAAISLGVIVVFGVCYELLFVAANLFTFIPRISHIYFVMGFTFILSTFVGNRRYR